MSKQGLIESVRQSYETSNPRARVNQTMNDSPLPTKWLNTILRRLLGIHIYNRFVQSSVADAEEEYLLERHAGHHWMARWVLIRTYGLICYPFARALLSALRLLRTLT